MAARGSAAKPAAVPVDRPVKLDRLADQIAALRKLDAQKAKIDAKRAPLIAAVKEAMGEATQGLVGGVPVVRWSTTVRRSVSAKLVREKAPDIAALCEVLTEVRTFQLLDEVKS